MSKTMLQKYIELAKEGTPESIAEIMADLTLDTPIVETKFIDYALSFVNSEEGLAVMEEYLFKGTQIQRNYATLFFARLGEYLIIRKAYDMGLIDLKQAFSR
jgi:hypothetical protein